MNIYNIVKGFSKIFKNSFLKNGIFDLKLSLSLYQLLKLEILIPTAGRLGYSDSFLDLAFQGRHRFEVKFWQFQPDLAQRRSEGRFEKVYL